MPVPVHADLSTTAIAARTCCQSGDGSAAASDTVPADGSEPLGEGGDIPSRSMDETPTERRLRESQGVLDRVQYIHSAEVRMPLSC